MQNMIRMAPSKLPSFRPACFPVSGHAKHVISHGRSSITTPWAYDRYSNLSRSYPPDLARRLMRDSIISSHTSFADVTMYQRDQRSLDPLHECGDRHGRGTIGMCPLSRMIALTYFRTLPPRALALRHDPHVVTRQIVDTVRHFALLLYRYDKHAGDFA